MPSEILSLWQKAIHLFHEATRTGWVGPFKAAGYDQYRLEHELLTKKGEQKSPDLVAQTEDGRWCVIELTRNDASKASALKSYASLDGRHLNLIPGLAATAQPPSIVVGRPHGNVDDGPSTQLVLSSKMQVRNAASCADGELRRVLIAADGADLLRVPSLPFSLVPEMKSSLEIREALVPLVQELFGPKATPKSAMDLADASLERLADKLPIKQKKLVADRVAKEMNTLILKKKAGTLHKYLEFSEGHFRRKGTKPLHPRTLESIGIVLDAWSKVPLPESKRLNENWS